MATEYIKCTACKCLRHITEEYEVYKGTRRKTCLKCKEKRNKNKCKHDKRKNQCKDCGGSQICEHGREKRRCKECDPLGHLKHNVSSRVRQALNSDKSKTSLEYLGCTIEQFKEHIGFQFETVMNWDNHGEVWHIDHIIPIKYKQDGEEPSLEDTIERLHWTNTQPLFSEENKAKGNKFIGKISGYDKAIKEQCVAFNAFK
jgi:hypothetical protein